MLDKIRKLDAIVWLCIGSHAAYYDLISHL
jgi:hypothetical protein